MLNLFEQQLFQNAAACKNIVFKIISARSPNFGGDRGVVKSFNTTIKKVNGTRTLLYNEIRTIRRSTIPYA